MSQRRYILYAAWIAAAVLLFVHASVTRDYLAIVGQLGLRSWIEANPATAATWILRLDRWIPALDAALEN